MPPERLNGLTDEALEELREAYEDASPEERRAMEIRDLGYPLTRVNETDERNLKEYKGK